MANINKNIIMQAGAAVANATNKAAGLSASTPDPGSIISAIQLVNGGRTIGPDALAHFTESVRNKLLSLLVTMEPIQDFNGYDHPWPGGGGKNKVIYPYYSGSSTTINGVTFTVDDNGVITANGLASANAEFILMQQGTAVNLSAGYWTISGLPNGGGSSSFVWSVYGHDSDNTIVFDRRIGDASYTFNCPNGLKDLYIGLRIMSGYNCQNLKVYPQFESGSSPTSYAPYSNICPISGRTGANAYVSPTPNVADAATYAADWTTPAGTVYAGSADIVSGDIKSAPYYASYNGETLVGPWVSSMDVYDPEGTPTTGAQVVDLGGTMTEYHNTGQDIITLVGDNYIWSDSGDVTITE